MSWRSVLVLAAAALPLVAAAAEPHVFDYSQARRTVGALCRLEAGAAKYAWLARAGCTGPARPILVTHALPDTELISALDQHQKVLAQARLLFAGNSSCASQRSFNYALASIGVSAAGKQSEEMVAWGFESDHRTLATVWARKSGASYDVWYVACQKPASPAR